MNTHNKSYNSNSNIILEMQSISKSFPGVGALREVNFDILRGEVHVLLGENGAGKSTLIKILAGVYPPDTGLILWHGQPIQFKTPRDAHRVGINIIYQESSLIAHLSVAENILTNRPAYPVFP